LTDKFTIFKTGTITYDKEWYIKQGLDVKPVNYTDGFLKEIASKTGGSTLEASHGDNKIDVIGYTNNYGFNNNELVAEVTTNEKLDGLGFSPEFSVNFIDKGDYYEAIDGELLKVILTDKPRSHILCNSVEGGSKMNEELINTLNGQIKDLNKQVAQKEAIIEANKKKLGEVDDLNNRITELEQEITTLKSSNEDYQAQIDGLKPRAEAYSKIEEAKKTELLNKAFGEDEEAKKAWKDASMEQLESLANHREITKKAQGIGSQNAEGVGEGNEGNEPSKAEKALEFYKKTHDGKEPSFIKQGGE
jgi:uncharacterized protein YoxC